MITFARRQGSIYDKDLNLNSLLVKRKKDNTSPGM